MLGRVRRDGACNLRERELAGIYVWRDGAENEENDVSSPASMSDRSQGSEGPVRGGPSSRLNTRSRM